MRQARKRITTLVIVLTMLIVFPMTALSESNELETVKFNHWYTLLDYSSNMTIYKLKLTGETLVSFYWKNVKKDDSLSEIGIFSDRNCNNNIEYIEIYESSSGSDTFIFYSGIYYIKMFDDNEQAQVKITTRKVSTINKANYCLSKAITLKVGKKVEIAQTRKDNYDRWYKFKLPKKQSISLYSIERFDFSLFDGNLNEISCSKQSNKYITVGTQPKGTYYLRIDSIYLSELNQNGKYITFYWK